jgi:uncharacterized protein
MVQARSISGWRGLLTGASSGVGRELALELARQGMRLVLAARRVDALDLVAAEIVASGGFKPLVVPTDLSHRGEAANLGATALDFLGDVDVLINNAGTMIGATQWESGDSTRARELFETNYWSPLALVRTLAPKMTAKGRGVIVNVSSLAPATPLKRLGYYGASKAALTTATDTLSLEMRSFGISVVQVILGPVDTPLLAEATHGSGTGSIARWLPSGDPAVAAERIAQAVGRPRDRVFYPRTIRVVLGFPSIGRLTTKFVPQRI